MTWFIDAKEHYPIIAEIEQQTDRGAAIIGAALLENYLLAAIETRLFVKGDYYDDVRREFCGEGRALGSFGSRIHAGFLLGLYLQEVHSDLQNIALIRNQFAHRSRVLDFKHRDIRGLCERFALINKVAHSDMNPDLRNPPSLDQIVAFVKSKPMRWRYIRTLQIIIGRLLAQKARPPPLPPLPNPF